MTIEQDTDRERLKSRRLVRMSFTIHIPARILAQIFEQLPEDTMLVRCGYDDFEHARSQLILWSRQFDPCPQSCALPELMVEVRRHEDGREAVRLMKYEDREWVPCQFG